MKRIALALVAVTAVLVSGVPAASAATGGGSAKGSTTQGSYEISSPRIDMDGSGLGFEASMSLDITVVDPDIYWYVEFTIAPAGIVPCTTGGEGGTGSAKREITYFVCPTDFRPTNIVKGKVTFTKYGDVDVVTTSDFSFTVGVTRAASQTTITKITRGSADNVMVYGRVTTTSREFGRVGVTSGSLHLFMKSGKRWIRVGDGFTTSAAGDYTAYNTRAVPRNAIFRVDYLGGPANLPSKSKERRG
jgi:hypothetical protein